MARADHIYVQRTDSTHHGIDAGDGTVIHWWKQEGAEIKGLITRTTMSDFTQGTDARVRRYGRRDDPDTIMARAESRLGEVGYDLVQNNCEELPATWCCTGTAKSDQIRQKAGTTTQGFLLRSTAAGVPMAVSAAAAEGLAGAATMMSGLVPPVVWSAAAPHWGLP